MNTMHSILNLVKELNSNKKIVIIPHKNPDADAIGSCLALHLFLDRKQINSVIISPNNYPKKLNWLPSADKIIIAEDNLSFSMELIKEADLIFCLDFNTLSRIDLLETPVKESKAKKVLIDHHQEPDNFDFVYSDTQIPATCELIYHFIKMMDGIDLINQDIATCIYAGIIADTGNFRFSSVKPSTHLVVSSLLQIGINHALIHTNIEENTSINKLKLLAKMIDKLEELKEFRTSIIHLEKEDLIQYKYEKGDTEGFVNYGLMLQGCVFSVAFFQDLTKDIVKISFRSKGNFDVNTFARKHFSGGGHKNAAGGISNLSLIETIQNFKIILASYKQELLKVAIC